MPVVEVNGARCRYRLDGPDRAPVLILSNSLGTTLEMWDAQMPALTPRFRVLRYDTRGHGGSEVTPGEYSIEQLGHDVLALADTLDIAGFSFCGLSMGGAVGLWLGLDAGPRLHKLVLCNTAAKIGSAEVWNARIDQVRRTGMAEVAAAVIARWFVPEFAALHPGQVETIRQQLLLCDPRGYAANCAAVRDAEFRDRLADIRVPLLFIAGTKDPVTSLAEGETIANGVADGRLAALDAAHLSNIGARAEFNEELIRFL